MANYTAADIKALREKTGAGMMDVKKALDESDGDQAKAMEALRIKGLKGATKREGRSTSDGLVATSVEGGVGTMIELNSETDFVAKSEPFVKLSEEVLGLAVANKADSAEALLAAETDGKPVSQFITESGASLGEKVDLRRVGRLEGAKIASYLHRTNKDLPPQVGVLLAFEGDDETVAHDVAVHIAAMAPKYFSAKTFRRARRERASHRRRHREERRQARAGYAEDRRGPRQRLLQGELPARPGIRQGSQAVRGQGARGCRRQGNRLPALPRRSLIHH